MSKLTSSISGGTVGNVDIATNVGMEGFKTDGLLPSDSGYDWSGAWEGFKKGMVSKYGEKAAHGLTDVVLGASEGKVNKATGYMSTGSVGSAMAKGAISGAIGSAGNPFATMAGAGIAGITSSLKNKQIRKQNQALEQYKKGMVKAEATQEKAKMYGERGHQKAAAMRGLGQTMSQALLG